MKMHHSQYIQAMKNAGVHPETIGVTVSLVRQAELIDQVTYAVLSRFDKFRQEGAEMEKEMTVWLDQPTAGANHVAAGPTNATIDEIIGRLKSHKLRTHD